MGLMHWAVRTTYTHRILCNILISIFIGMRSSLHLLQLIVLNTSTITRKSNVNMCFPHLHNIYFDTMYGYPQFPEFYMKHKCTVLKMRLMCENHVYFTETNPAVPDYDCVGVEHNDACSVLLLGVIRMVMENNCHNDKARNSTTRDYFLCLSTNCRGHPQHWLTNWNTIKPFYWTRLGNLMKV